jgi:hypothetical protein
MSSRRRGLFRLGEVEIELAKFMDRNLAQVVLSDLQQGTLQTVVQFPHFRDGIISVPVDLWADVELSDFAISVPRRRRDTEFKLSAEDFVQGERKKLKSTTVAVFRRSEATMDADYITHLRTEGLLKADMTVEDWEKLLLNCFKWQRVLIEESSDDLVPMVKAAEFERYLHLAKRDYGVSELGDAITMGGGKGGRH